MRAKLRYNRDVKKRKDTMKATIYQPNNPVFRVDKEVLKYDREDFKVVFDKEYDRRPVDGTDKQICDWFFEMTNMAKLDGFSGHSLSVGDIVEIDNRSYICTSFGWNEVMWKEYNNEVKKTN